MTDSRPSLLAFLRRRWSCLKSGHDWDPNLVFGPNYCRRCGKTIDWMTL